SLPTRTTEIRQGHARSLVITSFPALSSTCNRLSRMDLRKFPGILKQKIMTGREQASEGLKVGHGGQNHKNSYSARLYGTESRLCLAACTRTAVASTT